MLAQHWSINWKDQVNDETDIGILQWCILVALSEHQPSGFGGFLIIMGRLGRILYLECVVGAQSLEKTRCGIIT